MCPKRQMERIRKRYLETDDVHDRLRSGRPRKTTARDDSLLVRLIAPGGVDASDVCFVKNCMSDSCSQWSPWSYCCPETSAKQETAKKLCCVRQGPQPDGRFDSRKFDFSDESSAEPPIVSMTLRGPIWTHGSPQKTVKFGGGKIMVWGYIQYGGAREICKVDGNIDSAKYQQILASQNILNYKNGQIFQQDGAPCHTSGSTMKFLRGRRSRSFGDGQHSLLEHIWGRMKKETWRTKSKKLEELWDACKVAFHAIPDDFINKLYDSLPNRMLLFCRPKEPIQDNKLLVHDFSFVILFTFWER